MGLYAFPCARASKLNQQICISPAPGRSSKLTHTGVEIDTMCIPDRLSVVQCSHGHVIGVAFFRRYFSGVKRTCWTTGSWRSCLSLEVVSSIPAWSTIIYRFLCGFICVSLCQSIKIKPTNMYVCTYTWYTVKPFWKDQECLTKVVKLGSFWYIILYKSCLFYPSWQATSFERPPSCLAFTEGFHYISVCTGLYISGNFHLLNLKKFTFSNSDYI